jgi:hypothetical protein
MLKLIGAAYAAKGWQVQPRLAKLPAGDKVWCRYSLIFSNPPA